MSGTGFTVDVAQLKTAAAAHGREADTARQIGQSVGPATMPGLAWGALGASTGLMSTYNTLMQRASDHLKKVEMFLQWAERNLQATANSYQQTDQAVAHSFPRGA